MKKYFCIVWKTPLLSLRELWLVDWKPNRKWQVVFFENSVYAEDALYALLSQCGGIVKWWYVLGDEKDVHAFLSEQTKLWLLGTNDIRFAKSLKTGNFVARFKYLSLVHTDKEVKNTGQEILVLGDDQFGKVCWWQHIDLFSVIDFDKKVRWMQVGMMPAKLTQIMLNIAIHEQKKMYEKLWKKVPVVPTIYDPFCGFGTTWFVANSLGYNYIGSDIIITPSKQNQKWRASTIYHQKDRHMTLFKHDVTKLFTKTFLSYVDVIVSEWRLGPVVKKSLKNNGAVFKKKQSENIDRIVHVYGWFLRSAKKMFVNVPIVITIPVYKEIWNCIQQRIVWYAKDIGYTTHESIGETYMRKWQQVGRRVMLFM